MAPTKRPTPVDDEEEAESEGSEVIGVESAQSNLLRNPVSLAMSFANPSLTESSGRKLDSPMKALAMEQAKPPLKMMSFFKNRKRISGPNSRATINYRTQLQTTVSWNLSAAPISCAMATWKWH